MALVKRSIKKEVTINFEVNSGKVNKDGFAKIILRVTENRKHRRVNTGIVVFPKNWDSQKQRVKSGDLEYRVKNDILDKKKAEFGRVVLNLEAADIEADADSIMDIIASGRDRLSFLEFAEEYIKNLDLEGSYRTSMRQKTFLVKLKLFINGFSPSDVLTVPLPNSNDFKPFSEKKFVKDLSIKKITTSFVSDFQNYLKRMPNIRAPKKLIAPEHINKQMSVFKSLYNKCVIKFREKGYQAIYNPFEGLEHQKGATTKDRLTYDEIDKIAKFEIKEGETVKQARDAFILSFYTAGMRCGDILQLRGSDIFYEDGEYRLRYRMQKTGLGKDILLQEEAVAIISKYIDINERSERYIFSFLDSEDPYAEAKTYEDYRTMNPEPKERLLKKISSSNSLINKNLSRIARRAGIKKHITMHIARHSFANIARKANANVYDVSKALGHSSIKITEGYLSNFDTESQDKTLKNVYNRSDDKNSELIKALKGLSQDELKKVLEGIK